MNISHNQTIEAGQRWLNMAIAYQTRAEKLARKFNDPSDYPDSVFACYRGYARCMQMYMMFVNLILKQEMACPSSN